MSLLRILPIGGRKRRNGREKKNEEGEVERLGSLKEPEDPIPRKSDLSNFRKERKAFRANRDRTLEAPDILSVGRRGYFPKRTRFHQAFAKSENSTTRTSNLGRRRKRDTMSDRHFLHCPTRESLWGINLSTKNPPSSWAAAQSFFRRPIFSFFFVFFRPGGRFRSVLFFFLFFFYSDPGSDVGD